MENKITTKVFPSYTKAMDAETGIIEAYVSIFGIMDLDDPPDIIKMGAFAKTIQERGPAGAKKIRVLNQHWRSEVVGVPLALVEHTRDMLPPELLAQYPEATGGLFTRTQFVMDTQLGRETYALYKAGAMDEWSIGFDIMQMENVKVDDVIARLITEIKLWEYSPVTWGANPATATVAVKHNAGPASPEAGTSVMRLDDASPRAEPQKDALTRERLRVKILELSLGINEPQE